MDISLSIQITHSMIIPILVGSFLCISLIVGDSLRQMLLMMILGLIFGIAFHLCGVTVQIINRELKLRLDRPRDTLKISDIFPF